jgi:TusA-related sulfurtransferase
VDKTRREMTVDVKLDCFGLLCPMPIIQTAQKIKEMKSGEVLEVTSTDEGIKEDMPAWCRQTGHEYLGLEKNGEIIKVYVRKTKD